MESVLARYTEHLEKVLCQLGQLPYPGDRDGDLNYDLLVGDGLAAIVQMHDAHVHARKDTHSSVDELLAMKADYDNELLSLQNKRVEKMFYSRMIAANNSFQSEFTDSDVGMTTDDQSCEQPHATGAGASADAHNVKRKWLLGEADARQRLIVVKQELEAQQNSLKDGNHLKRQNLISAAAHVNEVISTCRPAFRHLSFSPLHACDCNSMLQLPHLPERLQDLYFQVASASALAAVPAQVEIESERQSRKRKLGSQELQVRLTISTGQSKVLIVFAYVPEMHVITARLSDKDIQHQHLLAALFPSDTGDLWPADVRPDAAMLAHTNARPYRWCQCLRTPKTEHGHGSGLQNAVSFISWFQIRYAQVSSMWAHFRHLQSKSWPVGIDPQNLGICDSVRITEWVMTQDIRLAPLVQALKDGTKEEGEVDELDRDTAPDHGTDLTIVHDGVIHLKRCDVSVRVRLTSSMLYPYTVSEFHLANEHCNYFEASSLADIEADVNIRAPLRSPGDPLPAQLRCLLQRLDAEL
eukprot:jgi/Ulvmu1/8226/UM041_0035.1